MNILLISSQDYIHHPVPSRHHYIFERLAERHNVFVAHFHASRGAPRDTKLIVKEATLIPSTNPLVHYTVNAPYHFYIINKIIKEEKIDVVVAAHVLAGTAAIAAARWNRIPVIFDLKDWFPDSAAMYIRNPLVKKLVRWTVEQITCFNVRHSTYATTVSPTLVDRVRHMGQDCTLITNGVDLNLFRPATVNRKELYYDDSDFIIGFVGSVERWYDIEMLIDAMMLLPLRVQLMIVGGSLFTNHRAELIKRAVCRGVASRVRFFGLQPYEKLPYFISYMNVCTIPLKPDQWRDIALPNKFFEYSACGKSIVATAMQNVMELQTDNVYVYEDCSQYVRLIRMLMNHNVTYSINVEQYGWDARTKQFEEMLECAKKTLNGS